MTGAQMTKRIAQLRTRLKLDGWRIRYRTTNLDRLPGQNRYARVLWFDHCEEAFVEVAIGRPDDEVDFSLRHEVAHIRLRELDALATKVFNALGEAPATDALRSAWEDALERAVNGIAEALGPP